MENEIKIQFALPNLVSMQDCLVNPPADWQQKICGKLQELVMDYLNSNHLAIKAQLADYADRRGIPVEMMRKFLASNLWRK